MAEAFRAPLISPNVSIHLTIYPSIYISIHPPTHVFSYSSRSYSHLVSLTLSTHQFILLTIQLSTQSFTYLSIHPIPTHSYPPAHHQPSQHSLHLTHLTHSFSPQLAISNLTMSHLGALSHSLCVRRGELLLFLKLFP